MPNTAYTDLSISLRNVTPREVGAPLIRSTLLIPSY